MRNPRDLLNDDHDSLRIVIIVGPDDLAEIEDIAGPGKPRRLGSLIGCLVRMDGSKNGFMASTILRPATFGSERKATSRIQVFVR
jgi:hypothetical protein